MKLLTFLCSLIFSTSAWAQSVHEMGARATIAEDDAFYCVADDGSYFGKCAFSLMRSEIFDAPLTLGDDLDADGNDITNAGAVSATTITGSGVDNAIHDNVSGEIAAVTEKTTIATGDLLLLEDSEASNAKKRATIENAVDARVVAVADNALNSGTIRTAVIADDGVVSIDVSNGGFEFGTVIVSTNLASTPRGIFAFRATSSSPFMETIATQGAFNVTTGALTGTTGSDAAVTISAHTDNKIYIENRFGGTRVFQVTINME